ncbi:MAG TPA: hypothetical protein PLL38_10560 [Anaerolineales bacterium]|nr:hypothetical protein [Anaerolineales bacterium]
MNQPLRLFLTTLTALAVAFAFSFFFLNLSGRSLAEQGLLIGFLAASLGWLIWNAPSVLSEWKFAMPKLGLRENLPGLLLALTFFAVYTSIGLQFNTLSVDTTDNFLDADNSSWITRIADPAGSALEMRGPHPFAYFIFRPFGWLLNLFTGSSALSATLLNTFTGALCVFLVWLFVKRQIQDAVYALLIASLLGLSTAHIFFGSVVETYIFSAAALIGFLLVLQKGSSSLPASVGVSVLTFGITLTNFVQNFILFAAAQIQAGTKNFKTLVLNIFRFTAFTLALGILLSILHAAWFPSSRLFFLPSDAQAEEEFAFSVFQEPSWKVIGRVFLLVRTVFLYAVIAPQPYVFGEEVGGKFPRFNFFRISPETFSYSSYDGVGNVLVLAWAVLLLVSGFFFLRNLVGTRKVDLSAAFILCVLFNFVLHFNYGYEIFLYSPDWAYALILFVALSLAPLAKNRFFQGGLAVFLILLAYNQFQFFDFIFKTIALFFDKGA